MRKFLFDSRANTRSAPTTKGSVNLGENVGSGLLDEAEHAATIPGRNADIEKLLDLDDELP
jgi:hypothetical protein